MSNLQSGPDLYVGLWHASSPSGLTVESLGLLESLGPNWPVLLHINCSKT